MITKVKKWGNSLGVRIPKPFANKANIEDGTEIDIEIKGQNLILKSTKPGYNLNKLVSKISDKNRHSEIITSQKIGKEIW